MVREGLEDIQRHKSDKLMNACKSSIINPSGHQEEKIILKKWADIQVGDLIIMKENEQIPADCILLGSNHSQGMCYIQTSSLDGEKALKPKQCLIETKHLFEDKEKIPTEFQLDSIQFSAQKPDSSLYSFEGSLDYAGKKEIISSKQLLLRGAVIKNTKWVISLVVYTGMDTKIMRNAENSKIKTSSVEKYVNKLIIGIITVQLVLCLLISLFYLNFDLNNLDRHYYLYRAESHFWSTFFVFWSYFLLLNTMLPISLIVSLEFIKIFQGYFINNDIDMYNEEKNKFVNTMTTTINEELGQVQYIFSDKTGTLTCNKMEFKYAVIGQNMYGGATRKQKQSKFLKLINKRQSVLYQKTDIMAQTFADSQLKLTLQELRQESKSRAEGTYKSQGVSRQVSPTIQMQELQTSLYKKVQEKQVVESEFEQSTPQSVTQSFDFLEYCPTQHDVMYDFLQIMASNHECIIEEEDGEQFYQGPSPDEITLAEAARNLDFRYMGIEKNKIQLEVLGYKKSIELLKLFEFNSTRKRMSIIIRETTGQIKLYCKGADNIIIARLSKQKQPYKKYIQKKLDFFCQEGLRTLCFAMRELTEQEYEKIDIEYNKLIDAPNREAKLEALAEEVEKDLYLLGCTGIEDRLQDNVSETISDLIKANIKVWMLTGDRLETAENIAKSCKLFKPETKLFYFTKNIMNLLKLQFEQAQKESMESTYQQMGIVVDGESLAIIFSDKNLTNEFIQLSQNCEAVVCCRTIPKQKAQVVRTIRNSLKKITLAIGDGANDVNMIQEADIGIGIYGNEGMRAVQAADFAIGEFQFLWKLLIYHGRQNYIRIAQMILYFFYKNMIFTIPQLFYSFISAYSGQTVFDDWYISAYNAIFTASPLVVRAVFDQDIHYQRTDSADADKSVDNKYIKENLPYLYKVGQKKQIFNLKNYLKWTGFGVLESVFMFIWMRFIYSYHISDAGGHNADLWSYSITYFTAIMVVVDLKLAIHTRFWTVLYLVSLIGLSLLIYFIYFFGSSYVSWGNVQYTSIFLIRKLIFYSTNVFLISTIFIFDLVLYIVTKKLKTDQILLDMIKINKKKVWDEEELIPLSPLKQIQSPFLSSKDRKKFQQKQKSPFHLKPFSLDEHINKKQQKKNQTPGQFKQIEQNESEYEENNEENTPTKKFSQEHKSPLLVQEDDQQIQGQGDQQIYQQVRIKSKFYNQQDEIAEDQLEEQQIIQNNEIQANQQIEEQIQQEIQNQDKNDYEKL